MLFIAPLMKWQKFRFICGVQRRKDKGSVECCFIEAEKSAVGEMYALILCMLFSFSDKSVKGHAE